MKMPMTIYLDNNSTTAMAPQVLDSMMPFLKMEQHFANPSSSSMLGRQVRNALEKARISVSGFLGARPAEVVFTSGATESNHTAILAALSLSRGKRHIVTSAVEHPSVLLLCQHLERLGVEVTYLPVDTEGRLDLDTLRQALREDTALVSLMWANNETGVIFPVREAAEIARAAGVYFHCDATQAVGRTHVSFAAADVDFLSCTGHKLHGPKGVGALCVRKGIELPPLFHGHQERGRRGGTENVAAIVGFGTAVEQFSDLPGELRHLAQLRDHFERGLQAIMPCARVHGQGAERLPNTSNIGFLALDGEELLFRLEQEGIVAALGAACAAGSNQPSHVLTAMGFSRTAVLSSLRFSFSRLNQLPDVDYLLPILGGVLLDMMHLPQPSMATANPSVSCLS